MFGINTVKSICSSCVVCVCLCLYIYIMHPCKNLRAWITINHQPCCNVCLLFFFIGCPSPALLFRSIRRNGGNSVGACVNNWNDQFIGYCYTIAIGTLSKAYKVWKSDSIMLCFVWYMPRFQFKFQFSFYVSFEFLMSKWQRVINMMHNFS